MTKNELKERVYAAIDRRAEEIVRLGERIRKHPELGFKELKTARLIEETLAGLGLKPKTGLALTGVRAEAPGRAGDGPTTIEPVSEARLFFRAPAGRATRAANRG